jgi:hypothetical protein
MYSLNHIAKFLPVCPTSAFLQSGHVSLYTPNLVYLSVVWCFVCQCVILCIVFMVRNAIFYVGSSECIGNEGCFLSHMCKCGPFFCCSLCGWLVFLWSRVGCFLVLDWERVVVHNIVYDIFLLCILMFL